MTKKYYTDPEMAKQLGISLSRLRAKLSEGCFLPPRIELPNSRTRLWSIAKFEKWLESYEKNSVSQVALRSKNQLRNRRLRRNQ